MRKINQNCWNSFLKTHLNTFGSNMFLNLEIMNFEDVTFIKKSFLCGEEHECHGGGHLM
jgi:hypothetical protein